MARTKAAHTTSKREREKKHSLFDEFQAELLTASKINAKCVTHNVDLEDKFSYIGHVATLPNDPHVINARTQSGKNVEFNLSISMTGAKEIDAKKSNPKTRS